MPTSSVPANSDKLSQRPDPSRVPLQRFATWSSSLLSRKAWTFGRLLWLGGVALLIALLFFGLDRLVGGSVGRQVEKHLETILNADVQALQTWFRAQETLVDLLADRKPIKDAAEKLTSTGHKNNHRAHKALHDTLEPLCKDDSNYDEYFILSLDGQILSARQPELNGQRVDPRFQTLRKQLVSGKTVVTAPIFEPSLANNEKGPKRSVTIWAIAPIRNPQKKAIAALAIGIDPEEEFSDILAIGHVGTTGETFAFNKEGYVLSELPRAGKLVDAGLLRSGESPVLRLKLRDPEVPLVWAVRPKKPMEKWGPTLMVASATEGGTDVNVMGYRNHLGERVVGAWTWIPEYNFGVATEMEKREAFAPHRMVRIVIWILAGLLAFAVLGIVVTGFVVTTLQKRMKKVDQEIHELGQYTLLNKIGEGGMGAVYKAQHAMLQRPTAVKLLRQENCSESDLARFEREVQLTSRLSHPNTIAIYDYGRAPDGLFYYAMEYLIGVTLEKFVEKVGPVPEARAIYVLQQVCSSLEEAHELGLVHRDIKPANIMLCKHGGQFDVVKVLDFGLVKDVTEGQTGTTTHNYILGTPLYLSPEAITTPEVVEPARDIYAVGAVAYYLLTGRPVFDGANPMQIFQKHMGHTQIPPSEVVGWDIDSDLESIVMRCLAKNANERPMTVGDLWTLLAECRKASRWDRNKAKAWWTAHASWFELPELFVPEGKPTMQFGRNE